MSMRAFRFGWCAALLLGGCTGFISDPGGAGGDGLPGPTGGGGGTAVEVTLTPLPAGVRRLGQAEVVAAATALLGVPADALGSALGTDTRQTGFTRNADQRLSSVQADALWQAATTVAHAAVTTRLQALAPCASTAGSEACARPFLRAVLGQAWRREPTAAEEASLLTVYQAGALGSTHAAGVELALAAVLQSPSFLYLTELGAPGAPAGTRALTPDELAASLAFLLTGAPPAATLVAQARAGALATPEGRAAAAQALLATPAGHRQVQRLVLEWLGADAVDESPKDPQLFPGWNALRADVLQESRDLVEAVLFSGDGRLQTLLSTDSTRVSPALASWYEITGSGPVPFPATRRGLLLTAGFLAANAHPTDTATVKRGAVVRKKLLCQELQLPTTLGPIVVPAPDPSKTTRERFQVHSQSEACAGCHQLLDPIGFALETFDPAGRYRTTENGKRIDPSGELTSAGDADGPFVDAVGLVQRLAGAQLVRDCFPRQLFRFASGRAGGDEEASFVAWVGTRPSAAQGRVVDLLVDWVRSESFATRRSE